MTVEKWLGIPLLFLYSYSYVLYTSMRRSRSYRVRTSGSKVSVVFLQMVYGQKEKDDQLDTVLIWVKGFDLLTTNKCYNLFHTFIQFITDYSWRNETICHDTKPSPLARVMCTRRDNHVSARIKSDELRTSSTYRHPNFDAAWHPPEECIGAIDVRPDLSPLNCGLLSNPPSSYSGLCLCTIQFMHIYFLLN